jgi:hypothetical protein
LPIYSLDVSGSGRYTDGLDVTGSLNAPIITGSLFGTASWAQNVVSASFAATSSVPLRGIITASAAGSTITFTKGDNTTFSVAVTTATAETASYISSSNVDGPFGRNSILTSSYAVTASYVLNSLSSSYALTSSIATNATNLLVYVKNSSGAQIDRGKVVRIVGASGDNALIGLADYTNDNLSANTLGILTENIPNDSFGYAMTAGTLIGVDTTAFTPGQLLYLGSSGSIIGTAPTAPLHAVRLGQAQRIQLNNGSIDVRIDNGFELSELHDILDTTTSGSYGDLLIKSGSLWVTSKTLTGSYQLTGSLTANSITSSLFGTSSWAQNAVSASYIPQSVIDSAKLFMIATGSVTASVNVTAENLFLIKSGANTYLNISSSGNTELYSNLFVVKNYTTKQPVLTVSQSIVRFTTQSADPVGLTEAGNVYFTATNMFIGLD